MLAVSLAGSTAFAADVLGLKNLMVDGAIEVKGSRASNETDNNDGARDTRDDTLTRVTVGVGLDVTNGVVGRFEAVRNSGSAGTESQYGGSGKPSTVGGFFDKTAVTNAYLDLTDFLEWDKVRLGRQYIGRKGDLLSYVGPVGDDALSVGSVDGLSIWEKVGPVQITGVTVKFADDDGVPGSGSATDAGDAAGDANISYLLLASDELIPLAKDKGTVPLELGYYSGTDSNTAAESDNNNLSIIDLRAGFRCPKNQLTAELEYAMNGDPLNGATNTDYDGSALLLKVGFKDDERGFGVRVLYANASGDDNPADTDDDSFRDLSAITGGSFVSDLRFGEIISNSNTNPMRIVGLNTGAQGPGLNIISLGGHYVLPHMDKKVTLKLDYYMVKVNEVASGSGADKDYGNELDLAVKYAHSETVHAAYGYAMLAPGDGLLGGFAGPVPPGTPNDNVTKAWAKLVVKWGGPE